MATKKLTTSQIRALPPLERIAYVEEIRVEYPRSNQILNQISLYHELNLTAKEPKCFCLVGPYGAGKTTLIQVYASRYPVIVNSSPRLQRVVRVVIPGKATVKNMYTNFLSVLGDPLASKGTIGNMEYRLRRLVVDCGVELVFFDEIQHFVDRDRHVILMDATDSLKTFIKEANIGCAFVGVDGDVQRVLAANPQFASLFCAILRLDPFAWDPSKPETIVEFRSFLATMEGMLPLNEPSNLSDMETAWRCFVASGGITRFLTRLLEMATVLALKTGQEHLDYDLLANAFDQFISGVRPGLRNPFKGDPPQLPLPSPTTSDDSKGTNNRSKQRKPSQETLNDIL
jgi:energy-coupling factor transporter ATP-binding protein EcfA2